MTTFTDSGQSDCTVTFSASGIASGGYNFITLSQGDLRLVIDNVIGSDVQVSQASGGGIGIGNNNIEQGEKISFSFEESDGSEVCADTFTTTIKADAGNPLYLVYYGSTFALQGRDSRALAAGDATERMRIADALALASGGTRRRGLASRSRRWCCSVASTSPAAIRV